MTLELVQGGDDWKEARRGCLTASRLHEAIARTKTGWGASRANYMADLIAERLTGQPMQGFTTAAMQWGTETEPEAKAAYSFRNDVDIVDVGFVKHPTIAWAGASPDGLVLDGLIECKCPNTATHIDTLISDMVPAKYITQMMWQMCCTGRKWCDFVSYDPRLPESMRLFVRRLERDDDAIKKLEGQAVEFLKEVDERVTALRNRYERHKVAA